MFKVREYKEEQDDKIVWNTEKVEKLLASMEEGYATSDHPFYEGSPDYKKGNIVIGSMKN